MKRRSLFGSALAALVAPALAKAQAPAVMPAKRSEVKFDVWLADEVRRDFTDAAYGVEPAKPVWAMYRPYIAPVHTHSMYDPSARHSNGLGDPGHTHSFSPQWHSGLAPGQLAAFASDAVPPDWIVCDGRNGTPDMRGYLDRRSAYTELPA